MQFQTICLISLSLIILSLSNSAARSTNNNGNNEVIKEIPLPQVPNDFLEAYYYEHYNGVRSPLLNFVRDGDATESNSCETVTEVPEELRTVAAMRPNGLSPYYTKYTEAYGIPVVATSSVPDSALHRACYVLRFLLADREDLRQAYYKNFGRVGIIPHESSIKTIPEYVDIDPRFALATRGLGAISLNPISTTGEENILCYEEDRSKDDLIIREVAQGIYHLAGRQIIPGLQGHLRTTYESGTESGWWENTYAEHSASAYFGEGVQSYFNVNAYADPADGYSNDINTRSKLRTYDSKLYNLIQSLFPCANNYIKRCSSRGNEAYQRLRMNCSPLPMSHRGHSRRSTSLF
ncbi:hypothetical protein CAPTEDRAFT_224277 [Capitella teleta]|uniref:Uncharacterized protein n=1 Tax=Capitella teleta TaxID=283909 RepID=R7U355_CAPTE|nr:hypothetical protein CAPTEDRAFT_224277 [Capitella teleta]|eukprot:ELT97610.1 hypothetical protein CAPTEDRAFT_224277 [Capitella teleta]